MKLFIANFPFKMTETDICDFFKIFGEIVECKMVSDPISGQSKGYGFIVFRHAENAKVAMKKMDGYRLSGRHIAVKSSTSESPIPKREKKLRVSGRS